MVRGCTQDASHKMKLGHQSMLLGNYEVQCFNKDWKHIFLCDFHIDNESKRHPWCKEEQCNLTMMEKECALCKSKVVISNGNNPCRKHMLIIAGQPYNVSCDFYDNHSGYTVEFNHTKYHKNPMGSDLYICTGCKDHYESIKELEEQHLKYLEMLASVMPVSKRSSVMTIPRSHESSQIEGLMDYAAYYLSNRYKEWEMHVHCDTDISICKWDRKTNCPSKKLEITKDVNDISLKLSMWNKYLPSSFPSPIDISSLQVFHKQITDVLEKLEECKFCEGITSTDAQSIVNKKQQLDAYVDNSPFMIGDKVIEGTVRSKNCVFQASGKAEKCAECQTLYRRSMRFKLMKLKKNTECETKKSSSESRCNFSLLSHEMLVCRARALAATLHNERRRKSYWYEAYVKARKEKKYKMPKSFSQNFTTDHLERLITESTKLGVLSEKSVLYYLMQDTVKSLQLRPKGM